MKKSLVVLFLFLALVAMAQSQEIFDALRKGDIQTVKALVEKSPLLVDARDGDGNTPLHCAAWGGDAESIIYLIDKGAKLELQNAQIKTPLHLAAMNDRSKAVAALIKRKAALEAKDDYSRTALILCARERGQAATARILIEAGADINAADKFGDTTLSLAAWRGKGELVNLLLEKGAAVPASGQKWQNLLSVAASKGLTNLFRRLTDRSQDLKGIADSEGNLLYAAARGGAAEIVDALLNKGFDPAERNSYGWTPLHYAALDGRTEAARKLIERNAPLDSRTTAGQTPYNIARERGMDAVASLLVEKGAAKDDARFPVLEGDYLGQKPPAGKADVFALGIVSSIWGLHSTAVFSPDGSEVYWAPMMTFPGEIYSRGGLLMMKRVDGRWSAPAWAPFSGPKGEDDVPFFSPDGKKIYFISQRPLPGGGTEERERIWCANRTPKGWSEPRPLDAALNDNNMHWEFSLDNQGNLYFGGQAPDSRGLGDIYLARFFDGKYEKPVNLGEPISSSAQEGTPFIAPDGSYLLFSRQYDLWVSFKATGGAWSEPIKLGPEVNSPGTELCPVVTADGKYLFFTSTRGGESHAYWVRADVIEKARPKAGPGIYSDKKGVLQKIASLLESKYVLSDKAKGFADEFKVKCASGAYASYTEAKAFAEKITGDLIEITHDKHLNFRVIEPSDIGETAESPLHHPVRYYRLRNKENTGFYKLEWIEPNIGYVDIRRFNSFGEAKDMVVAAMRFLSSADAIIIDVRENGGGSGDYLSSYFLPYPTQLSSSYSRQDGSLTEFWTLKDIGTEPRTDVPLFILTSPRTFSAAESFAYDMKSRKRAVLVGEPTKGGAHSVDLFGIDNQFEFYISTSRAISPVTGGNWEGAGVVPDIRVPAAAALNTALEEAKKAGRKFGQAKEAKLKKAVDEMQLHLDNAEKSYRENRKESAAVALDSLFRIAEKAGLISEFFIDVFAYNFQSAQDEQMLFAILEKEIEFFPNSPSAYERLASVHYSKGHKELALRYFQKVLELDPDNRNAAKMIKELQNRQS